MKLRRPLAIILMAGLLLVIMGQPVYRFNHGLWRWFVYLIILSGLLLFSGASYILAGAQFPRSLSSLVNRSATFLSVSPGQIMWLSVAPLFALLAYLAAGDGSLAHSPVISISSWILAILAVLAGTHRPAAKEAKVLDRSDWLIVLGLFILALILRVFNLEELPPTLSGDEGSAGLFAINFLNGEANNIFVKGWFSFPALYFAVQSLAIWLFDQTAF
jgi:hypothetical protein